MNILNLMLMVSLYCLNYCKILTNTWCFLPPLVFYIGTSASIDTYIILTPYNGDADLFVGKRCNFSDVEQNHYRWVSVKSGSAGGEDGIDSVTISKTDPNRCIPTVAKPCRYCIKVKN